MEPWRNVHLTRARQVGELMELRAAQLPAPEVTVRAHYEMLRGSDPAQAVEFIGHALPRHEAVYWAAELVAGQPAELALSAHESQALDHVRAWLDNPGDARRREAYAAAQKADMRAPERTLAAALFYSGGSIAPVGAPPVLPAPGLGNQLAVVAVVQAAYRSGDPEAFFVKALRSAEAIAEHGIADHA